MSDNTTPVREFVLRRVTEGLSLGGHEFSGNAWYLILGVVLTIGLVYVVWMYVRDGHSIGWFWGSFLALLRLGVYGVIAAVFLLPAWQNWEETRQQSKVVLAFDVSRSMLDKKDDPVSEGMDAAQRPTRQDKVLAFLGEPTDATGFFKRLQKTSPVTFYRWGSGADEDYVVVTQDGLMWERKPWEDNQHEPEPTKRLPGQPFTRDYLGGFLKPDLKAEPPAGVSDDERKAFDDRKQKLERLVKSTNAGESALAVLSKEINNMPQALVLFSDCRSTEGGPQAFKDLADRARRAKVPVFVVVVGEDRPETKIEITDARGPDIARPEDPFPLSVDVTGVGLPGRDITVLLDVFRPDQDPKKDQPVDTVEKKVPFKGTQVPRAQVEFPILPAKYGEIPAETPDKPADKPGEKPAGKPAKPEEKPTKPEFKVGDWKFVARVARDPAETTSDKFHTKEPVIVKVVKRPLRVLLMASAPTRDYQFVRTMMVRESDKKRLELSIFLQPLPQQDRRAGIVQDVPPDRMLTRFPDKLDDKKATEEAQYNLANYDVIVAFDPDWTQLTKEQADLVERWVSQQGGGLVVVAGPIHTLELARPGASGLKPGGNADVAKLKPILDIYPVELKDVRLEKDRNTAIPAGLAFPNATPEMEFLKLDEENEKSGLLDAWNEFFRGKQADNPGQRLLRGFYGFYPVKKAKDTSITVATFKDDTSTDKSEPPYLVITPTYGKGRVVWLGSGETWRLRQFREVWHERFWTKLVRYASAGSMGTNSRRIAPSVGDKFPAGSYVEIEAQFFGKDLKPLPRDVQPKPKVVLRPPVGVADMKTEYEMAPKTSGGGDWEGRFLARILMKSPGKYGVDISLNEPGEPPQSKTIDIIETDAEMQNTRPDLAAAYELASDADDVLARVDDPAKKQQLRQALQRFKGAAAPGDKPAAAEKEKLRLVFDLHSAGLIPDCMHMVESKQQSRGKVDDLWDDGWALPAWLAPAPKSPEDKPWKFSYVLAAVVGLLSIEWLTRKLLRLA